MKAFCWILNMTRPSYIKGFAYFDSKEKAIAFKDEQEMLYRRIGYSDPIPLYLSQSSKMSFCQKIKYLFLS